MLKLTFAYVRERGLEPTTYKAEWRRLGGAIAMWVDNGDESHYNCIKPSAIVS